MCDAGLSFDGLILENRVRRVYRFRVSVQLIEAGGPLQIIAASGQRRPVPYPSLPRPVQPPHLCAEAEKAVALDGNDAMDFDGFAAVLIKADRSHSLVSACFKVIASTFDTRSDFFPR